MHLRRRLPHAPQIVPTLTLVTGLLVVAPAVAPGLAAQDGTPVRRGQAVPGTLTSSAEHTYTLELYADRFVFGQVDQHTVDVVVAILDPEGEVIRQFDGMSLFAHLVRQVVGEVPIPAEAEQSNVERFEGRGSRVDIPTEPRQRGLRAAVDR